MLYPSTAPTLATLLHTGTGSIYTQERLGQSKRHFSLLLRMLVSLLLVSLSACATQQFSTTHSAPTVQAVQRSHTQELPPSVAPMAADHTVKTATDICTRGQKALEAGRYEEAIELFGQAIEIDAANALYYLWLGRAYGHQAEQTKAGGQFFLARQVRKNLEKAVTLNPDLIEARLDLLTYYLQAPSLLGGGIEKAQAQAVEITKRDPRKGALAWQQCQQAKKEGSSLLAVSR